MSSQRWDDLAPDPEMLRALNDADAIVTRDDAISGNQSSRNGWSNRFADACALMVASEVATDPAFKNLVVRPERGGPAEPLTFIAGGRSKRVDVVVSSMVSGLQLGFSLKGMNFRDSSGLQFDKNLTGRTYELQDEVSVIHRYQPAAFLVALYFMPIAATEDKKSDSSPSSFARTVAHLRSRTGRLDATLPSQLDRLDAAAIALYVPGDHEQIDDFAYVDSAARGVVRYFDVMTDPPRRGRPKLEATVDLPTLVRSISSRLRPESEMIDWAEPEQ